MTTLMQLYTDETTALNAADSLIAAGVLAIDMHIMVMQPDNDEGREGTFDNEDVRGQRVGSFDDADASVEPEGRFDDTTGHRTDLQAAPKGRFDDGQSTRPRISYAVNSAILTEITNEGVDHTSAMQSLSTARQGAVLLVRSDTIDESQLRGLLGG